METVAIDTQWVETFMLISKEETNSPTKIDKYNDLPRVITKWDKYGFRVVDHDEKKEKELCERRVKFLEQREMRMKRMQPLFASQPRLEMICKDWNNDFVDTGFTRYTFWIRTTDESFKNKEDDLKYLINLCGYNLTDLTFYDYPSSQIMPLIKSTCFNLTKLVLRFKQVESKDFDNVFSNMNHLETLSIYWPYENPTLPMTLIKSLDQIRETLKKFTIKCMNDHENFPHDKPVSSASSVLSSATEALMTVISNMKNLEDATIKLDYGFTNEFFINLVNNSKNLKYLNVCASNITDKGLIAINNLKKLKNFSLIGGYLGTRMEKKFITDKSIQCLFNEELSKLDISDCIQVTNSSIIELVKNLPNLKILNIKNTKANIKIVEEMAKITKDRELPLTVYVSFKTNDNGTYSLTINPSLRFAN